MTGWSRNAGVMQGWVGAARTEAQVEERLAQVPDDLRDQVRGHVDTIRGMRWIQYVIAGRGRGARRDRLAEAPERLQPCIERAVRQAFQRKRATA